MGARRLLTMAYEAVIDVAYAMDHGVPIEEAVRQATERRGPLFGSAAAADDFREMLTANVRLVRRVLRDTGACWSGVPGTGPRGDAWAVWQKAPEAE